MTNKARVTNARQFVQKNSERRKNEWRAKGERTKKFSLTFAILVIVLMIPAIELEIEQCLKVLRNGGTILYPTDTIWGIGCDATNSKAVNKIYRLKKRVESKSLIILLDTPEKIKNYVTQVPEIALDLLENIDRPLTIIYPGAKNLAKNVIAEDNSIAIRIVKNEFCRKLIHEFDKPIVSSSANISGEPSPLVFKKYFAGDNRSRRLYRQALPGDPAGDAAIADH